MLYIPLSVDRHLDYFHLLAVVNNAAMNSSVQVSEHLFPIPLGIYLGVEMLGHRVILFLIF